MSSRGRPTPRAKQGTTSVFTWQNFSVLMTVIMVPWILYVNFRPAPGTETVRTESVQIEADNAIGLGKTTSALNQLTTPTTSTSPTTTSKTTQVLTPLSSSSVSSSSSSSSSSQSRKTSTAMVSTTGTSDLPVLGPVPTNGVKPLFGVKHQGGDAIFALACNYPKEYYARFVGSLRKFGYNGDIVLAVSPLEKMKPGVAEYVKKMNVVAYGFEVDCAGTDNCKLKDDFLGYPDPRPHRTFANIRYALYEYWLRQYRYCKYILIHPINTILHNSTLTT